MIFENAEYKQHKGTFDDLSYRRATADEEVSFRKIEKLMGTSVSASVVAFLICLGLLAYIFFSGDFSEIFIYGALAMVVLSILCIIRNLLRVKKSESYEVAEGVVAGVMRSNQRVYVSVWCEKEQILIPKVIYRSTFHCYKDTRVYIIRGNRGDGKKSNYFCTTEYKDPILG